MPINWDKAVNLGAWVLTGISVTNRIMKSQGGPTFGEAVESVFGKSQADLKKKPAKVKYLSAGNMDKRVDFIRQRIHKDSEDPRIREMVAGILSRKCGKNGHGAGQWCVREKDWLGEIDAIFTEFKKNVRYTRDPRRRDMYGSAPRTIFQWHIGDCDCLAIGLGAMLYHAGHPLKIRIIHTQGNKTYNHVYLLVGIPPSNPSKWIAADPSLDKPLGSQAPASIVIKHKDYKVSP